MHVRWTSWGHALRPQHDRPDHDGQNADLSYEASSHERSLIKRLQLSLVDVIDVPDPEDGELGPLSEIGDAARDRPPHA